MTLLIIGIMLDLLRCDESSTLGHIAEFQLPHGQHSQPIVAEHSDVKLTPLDVLLGDCGGAYPLMNEADTLRQLLIGVDDGCLRDAVRPVLTQALNN